MISSVLAQQDCPPRGLAHGSGSCNGMPIGYYTSGFQQLLKLGWQEGSGLGAQSQGSKEPFPALGLTGKEKPGLGLFRYLERLTGWQAEEQLRVRPVT